jgi:hypothetical protein
MKNAATIFLLSILVSIQTPVGQIFKLPLLVEHFIKHQKQEDVSLFDFLKEHYKAGHNDADLPEDEGLPFKNSTVYSMGYVIIPSAIKPRVIVPLLTNKKLIFAKAYVVQPYLSSIFHPPRVS